MTGIASKSVSGTPPARIGIVGGGLAGLAAAVVLAEQGLSVELFETRRQLGGRATSFQDAETEEVLDHCQHVALGCCTNFTDFCQRTGVEHYFRRDELLHFFGPDGQRCDLKATPWLPAPLHLAPALLRLSFLTWRERFGIGHALLRLAREPAHADTSQRTIGRWLREQGQSPQAIRRFWEVVLISALAESVDLASFSAARKVFVDGFLRAASAYQLQVPQVPLRQVYDGVFHWLATRAVSPQLGFTVTQVETVGQKMRVSFAAQPAREFDFVVLTLPWRRLAEVLPVELQELGPTLDAIPSSAITSLHLWFDRPIMNLPHAVLVDRLSQWVFQHSQADDPTSETDSTYYQVVISGSQELAGRQRTDVIEEVLADLRETWPAAQSAKLLRWRMVTQQHAVFSVRPETEALRPPQSTLLPRVLLAGDWTRTGWPATMEGAVRSGYLAAEAIMQRVGSPREFVVPDLAPSWLARLLGLA